MNALAKIKGAMSKLKKAEKHLGEGGAGGQGPRGHDGHENNDPANHRRLGDVSSPRGRDGHENNDPANHRLGDANGPRGRDGHESNDPGNKHATVDRLARATASLAEVAHTLAAGTTGHKTEQRLQNMVNEAAQVEKDDQQFDTRRSRAIEHAAFEPRPK